MTRSRVSNYTGLDDCSVFTVYFIVKITKLDQQTVWYSVLTGYGLFRVFLTKNNKEQIQDHGNCLVSAGVRFYQGTV